MKVILANPKVVNPIRSIRDIITQKTGTKIPIFTSNDYVKPEDEVIIRWANSFPVKVKDTVYNSPKFIQIAGNKLECSVHLVRNNINTIEFNTRPFDNNGDDYFPIIIRKTLHGKGGEGIVIVENMEDFNNNFKAGDVWTHFINFSSEYRIHVMGGEIKRIFKKVLRDGEKEDERPIRNLKKYDFSLRSDIDAFPKFQQLVKELFPVTKEIGGNFFALDVGIEKETKIPIIIEINTGPGLGENTANMYADYFIKELL